MKKCSTIATLCLLLIGVLVISGAAQMPIAPQRALPMEQRTCPVYLPFNPAHLMVKFQPNATSNARQELLNSIGATVEIDMTEIGWQVVRYDMEINYNEFKAYVLAKDYRNIQRLLDVAMGTAQKKAAVLSANAIVDKVDFDWAVQLFETDYTPNDPYFIDADPAAGYPSPQQWTSFDVQLPEAWDVTHGSTQVIIAIIDSGTDTDHPDLRDNILRNQQNQVIGWDYVGNKDGELLELFLPNTEDWNPDIHWNDGVDDGWGLPDPSAGDGEDMMGSPSSECDLGVFHGTWTASCASGVTDNGLGVAGAGFSCKIMPLRVITPEGTIPMSLFGSQVPITQGVIWATNNNTDIISLSLGATQELGGLHDAIINAYNQGIAIFCASGNSGNNEMIWPAAYDEVLAVGSFSQAHHRAYFSTYGNWLDLLAGGGHYDGSSIETAEWIWGSYVYSVCDMNNGGPEAGSHGFVGGLGTSAACPQAAGIGALVLSVAPTLSPAQLYNILRNTCLDIGAPGWDVETGYGIIQARAAVDAASGAPGELRVTLTPQGSTIIPPGGGTLTYTVQIRNTGYAAVRTDFWEDITLPSGQTTAPVILRRGIRINAGQTITRTLTQNIGGSQPAGNYVFNAYVGTYQGTVAAEAHFNFSKSGVDSPGLVTDMNASGWEDGFDVVQADAAIPQTLALHQNAPNPFNPTTVISYDLPSETATLINVYDLSGRLLKSFHLGVQAAGAHSFTWDASSLTSGVYVYELRAGNSVQARKALLLK